MQKRTCLIAVAMALIVALPAQAQDLSSLVGTLEVTFAPMQVAGIRTACTLVYKVIGPDHAYRQGKLITLAGNIAFAYVESSRSLGLSLKITTIEILDRNAKPEAPFFAYIQTPRGTTARSKIARADGESPGSRFFVYQFDTSTMDVLADILKGEPVTIGFNRQKGGLDVLVPLDLQVVESTVSESGFVHRRSNETLLQFSSCVQELVERADKQLKAK